MLATSPEPAWTTAVLVRQEQKLQQPHLYSFIKNQQYIAKEFNFFIIIIIVMNKNVIIFSLLTQWQMPQYNEDNKLGCSLNDTDIRAGLQLFTIFGGNKDLFKKTGSLTQSRSKKSL